MRIFNGSLKQRKLLYKMTDATL